MIFSGYVPSSGIAGSCSVAPSCLTLCDPMDCSPPGSSVYGIFQVRILEWVSFLSPAESRSYGSSIFYLYFFKETPYPVVALSTYIHGVWRGTGCIGRLGSTFKHYVVQDSEWEPV